MKKVAIILFALLVFVNGIMLTFQYHVYSDKLDDVAQSFRYSQVIDVTYQGNKLVIKQTFTNLPKSPVSISWPKHASTGKKCVKDAAGDAVNCERLDKTMTQFKKGESATQQIQYTIPLKKGMTSEKLLTNIFATLKRGIVTQTQVHITDEKRIGGQWFTGLPNIATKKMTLIDYSYFSGKGAVYELYWQKKPMKKAFTSDEVTIYGRGIVTEKMQKALSNTAMNNSNHLDIIQTNNLQDGYRILFVKNITDMRLAEQIAVNQVKQNYTFTGTSWLPAVVASFLTGDKYGDQKTKEMVTTLDDFMTDAQKNTWKNGLESLEGEKISTSKLDKLLGQTLDSATSYFTMNAQSKKVAPLLFEDSRTIYVNKVEQKNMQVILKDGRVLYAAEALFDTLGYTAKKGNNGYYVSNKSQHYRFPMSSAFYVYNNKRYDIASQPFEVINGHYYIEETWLLRLFGADIQKADKRIDITISDDALK